MHESPLDMVRNVERAHAQVIEVHGERKRMHRNNADT
jgi:hypothetical protein